MKASKKLLALLLAFIMVLSVACGSSNNKTAQEEPKKEDAEKKDEEKPADDSAQTEEDKLKKELEEFKSAKTEDTFVVGSEAMNGDFMNGFSNNTYDVYVKALIGNYGTYSTYTFDKNGGFVFDPITNASEPKIEKNADGSKTYTFTLNDKLVWNNGERITAKDYVFNILWRTAPQWSQVGSNEQLSIADGFLGHMEYKEGKTDVLKGIKYIDDSTFSVTLDASEVPYFYEASKVAVAPAPMARFAPKLDIGADGSSLVLKEGVTIDDSVKKDFEAGIDSDIAALKGEIEEAQKEIKANEEKIAGTAKDEKGEAIKLTDEEKKATEEANKQLKASIEDPEKGLNAQIAAKEAEKKAFGTSTDSKALRDAVLKASMYEVRNNYKAKPDVTCGPYNFVSFQDQVAKVTINDKFLGDIDGKKPTIKNIAVQKINTKLAVDLVLNGAIDFFPMAMTVDNIKKAKEAETQGKVKTNNYNRNGYGMISFITDLGATKIKEVRQAVAYLLDRDKFIISLAGGYGQVINGAYGSAEWTYQAMLAKHEGEDLEEEVLKLNQYTLNVTKANEVLDKTDYKFEKDGKTPWSADKAAEAAKKATFDTFDYWRYNSKGEVLSISHFATVNNEVSELIQGQIQTNGMLAGLKYVISYGDFATLLDAYYTPDLQNPKYTAFNLGTGFSIPNDPYFQYHSKFVDGGDNRQRVNDPELDKLLVEWRKLESTETDKYLEGWVKFQQWFNDYLPVVPLYANEYFDVFSTKVGGVNTNPIWAWYYAICNFTLAK